MAASTDGPYAEPGAVHGGGVSLLIMVGVGLDTVKQIQSQLEQHSYTGFLR